MKGTKIQEDTQLFLKFYIYTMVLFASEGGEAAYWKGPQQS